MENGIDSIMQKTKSFKVVIAGKSFVGKTSIVQRIGKSMFIESYTPTVGSNIVAKAVELDGKKAILLLTDIAGHQFFDKAIPAFFKRARVVLLVYDITDIESFNELEKWYNYAVEYANDANIIIVGNKIDLEAERVVKKEEGFLFAKEKALEFIEISAKTMQNLDQVLELIIKTIKR
ncbi:MAG: Rab family GTPase [Candidatus Heimdallarchaeaceae archaeon]